MITKVNLEVTDRVATVTFAREDGVNVIYLETQNELRTILDKIEANSEVEVVLLRGRGKSFLMGINLDDLTNLSPLDLPMYAKYSHQIFNALERLRPVTIAVISGPTFGCGCEIALACDFRIAAEDIRMGLPEVSLGLLPAGGGATRLARLVGTNKAMELILSARVLTGVEAREVGIVNECVPRAQLDERVQEMVNSFLKNPRQAVKLTKAVLRATSEASLEASLVLEQLAFGLLSSTADANEALRAFREKRKPKFIGR